MFLKRIRGSNGTRKEFGVRTHEDVKSAEQELAELVADETDRPAGAGRQPCGRIVHDERGNAVWQWSGETSTADSYRDSDNMSGILERMDPLDLTVEGQGGSGSRAAEFDLGGGYDPYNQVELRARTGIAKTGSRGKR